MNELKALLILSVTLVILTMIFAYPQAWIVILAIIIILTTLILATVDQVDKLPDVLHVMLNRLGKNLRKK